MNQLLRQWRDRALYQRLRSLRERDWRRRHRIVFASHPEYQQPCPPAVEQAHRQLWAPFRKRIDPATLRICSNISGIADPRVIPEEIFAVDIEPALTERGWCHFLQHKSLYAALFPCGQFPRVLLHGIFGSLYNSELELITRQKAKSIIDAFEYPILIKPNKDSMGGANMERF